MMKQETDNDDARYQAYERKYFQLNGYYNRNYRLNDSKSLVELWVKNLCIFVTDKIWLVESELRTDDYDEHWLKVCTECEMCSAQSLMQSIESIWGSHSTADGSRK